MVNITSHIQNDKHYKPLSITVLVSMKECYIFTRKQENNEWSPGGVMDKKTLNLCF